MTSYEVFMGFVKVEGAEGAGGDEEEGEQVADASGILSRECYEAWLKTRKQMPKNAPRAFKDALKTIIQASNRCRPFPKAVEADLLKHIRKVGVWPCFQDEPNCQIGKRGWNILGFHESKNPGKVKEHQQKVSEKREEKKRKPTSGRTNGKKDNNQQLLKTTKIQEKQEQEVDILKGSSTLPSSPMTTATTISSSTFSCYEEAGSTENLLFTVPEVGTGNCQSDEEAASFFEEWKSQPQQELGFQDAFFNDENTTDTTTTIDKNTDASGGREEVAIPGLQFPLSKSGINRALEIALDALAKPTKRKDRGFEEFAFASKSQANKITLANQGQSAPASPEANLYNEEENTAKNGVNNHHQQQQQQQHHHHHHHHHSPKEAQHEGQEDNAGFQDPNELQVAFDVFESLCKYPSAGYDLHYSTLQTLMNPAITKRFHALMMAQDPRLSPDFILPRYCEFESNGMPIGNCRVSYALDGSPYLCVERDEIMLDIIGDDCLGRHLFLSQDPIYDAYMVHIGMKTGFDKRLAACEPIWGHIILDTPMYSPSGNKKVLRTVLQVAGEDPKGGVFLHLQFQDVSESMSYILELPDMFTGC